MKKQIIYSILAVLSFTGCVEEMDINVINPGGYRLTVDGVLSNEAPPYYFRIGKTAPFSAEYTEGINDALVIISDDSGIRDTLVNHTYGEEDDVTRGYGDGDWDNPGYPDDSLIKFYSGFYKTTKIQGKEGHTYTLTVEYQGKVYEAKETMPFVTPIDSVWLKYIKIESKNEYNLCPYINFRNNLSEKNYYLFTFKRESEETLLFQGGKVWPFSILEDTHLPENVLNFNINDGETARGYQEGLFFYFNEGDSAEVRLNTITKECYTYYSDLIQQMRFDGGAFTPAPTTPRGNISNGALGYFRVSAAYEKRFYVDSESIK